MPPKPKEVVRKLGQAGFTERIAKGAHRIFFHSDGRRTVVSLHTKELKNGTFRKILKDIAMSEAEFRDL